MVTISDSSLLFFMLITTINIGLLYRRVRATENRLAALETSVVVVVDCEDETAAGEAPR